MTDTEKAALERRIDELCAEVERGKAEFKKMDVWHSQELKAAMDENAKLREQTELLVTLLRNDCDIEASWDGLRKFWYIGLTESGCLMRDRACKAEAENERLRKAKDTMRGDAFEIGAMLVKARDENAKLRELVDELYPLADYGAMDVSELDRAHDLMRELGVDA